MSRHSRSLARLADDLDREKARQGTPANGFEVAARLAKATAIADAIFAGMCPSDRLDHETPGRFSHASQDLRDQFAAAAYQRPPGLDTWELVVARIGKLVEGERGRMALQEQVENDAPARVCLQCFRPLECEPWPAPAPLYCEACEATRYARVG